MKQFILLFILCTSSLFAFGQKEYQTYLKDANEAFKNGDYDKAQKDYWSYIEMGGTQDTKFITNVENCKTLLSNADALFKAGNYPEAKAKYQELLNLNSGDRHAKEQKEKCVAEINRQVKERDNPPVGNTGNRGKTIFENPTKKDTPPLPPPPSIKKINFGVKAGLNLSNIFNSTNDMNFSPKLKPDFHAGIFVNMRFGGWGLQPELLYSRAGFENNGNAVVFNYITVPVLVKRYFGGFNFELGPYFSYLATVSPGSTVITIEEADYYSKAVEIKLSDLEKGTDFGVAVGIGYDFDFGLTIGARYSHGLCDMAKNLQWKNSVAAISLGFKFK